MIYILGILTGLLLAIIVFLATKRYNTTVERTLNQLENKIKEKGDVFIEEDSQRELDRLLENLPKE